MQILISDILLIFSQVNKFSPSTYTSFPVAQCSTCTIPDSLFHVSIGVRMLRQEPTECLFSFICTSNNHISRIQGMVERLCQALGTPLCQLDQTAYHNFPSLSVLAGVQFCLFRIILSVVILNKCTVSEYQKLY